MSAFPADQYKESAWGRRQSSAKPLPLACRRQARRNAIVLVSPKGRNVDADGVLPSRILPAAVAFRENVAGRPPVWETVARAAVTLVKRRRIGDLNRVASF
jgi:hypothetical protein